jgi:multidrug efflux pump subunit AcrB
MHAFGFSINNLSLFGLVLAIGIVVDDAIVVVENVERNIALGLSPTAATQRAMKEVSGPIIATALVLCAVFIPTAFISGLTGQFYKQFAITIAISTVISAFNSLTLSPALSALLLRTSRSEEGFGHARDGFRVRLVLPWFNLFFDRSATFYGWLVRWSIRLSVIVLIVYGGLLWMTKKSFEAVPEGFVPVSDKQYLVAFAQLPDGASLERTDQVLRKMSDICLKHPGREGFYRLSRT